MPSPPRTLPTLVLLPGLDGTAAPRAEFARLLAGKVVVDVIAFPVDIPLSYAQLEALVREHLPQDRPFVVLGESFSGPIAIRIAAHPPPQLCGVVLCATFARSPYPRLKPFRHVAAWVPVKSMPRWLRGLLMWGKGSSAALKPNSERALAQVSSRVLRHRIVQLLQIDVRRELSQLSLPTLIVHASDDRIVPVSATRTMIEAARHATVVPINGPHLLLQSRAQECVLPIAQFVTQVTGGSDYQCA